MRHALARALRRVADVLSPPKFIRQPLPPAGTCVIVTGAIGGGGGCGAPSSFPRPHQERAEQTGTKPLFAAIVALGLALSNGDARRLVRDERVLVDGVLVTDEMAIVSDEAAIIIIDLPVSL